jgi:hypothetical protein
MDSTQQRLIILDPGLRELGGHHPATMLAISEALSTDNINIELLCHQDCPKTFIENGKNKVKVTQYFTTDFYQYFYQLPTNNQLYQYCNKLALEYIMAIRLCMSASTNKNQKMVFWCHTLNWQHAKALALALDALKKHLLPKDFSKIKILIGLMYSPLDAEHSIKRKMHYELAFRHLAKHHNVNFFAVDYELQQSYSTLLGKDVDIQPCLLLGDNKTNNHQSKADEDQGKQNGPYTSDIAENNETTIILYTGDAKLNKGFAELPKIVEFLLLNTTGYQYVIQYSITNDSVILSSTDIKLQRLAQQYTNLRIKNQFVEHKELIELFQSSDAILFNYNAEIYQHQSSGVLWLAAYYQLNIINLTRNWISRESNRLNLTCFYCNGVHELKNIIANIKPKHIHFVEVDKNKSTVSQVSDGYRNKLFANVSTWLNSIINTVG